MIPPALFLLCLLTGSHLFYMAQAAGFNMHGNDSQHLMWVNAVQKTDSNEDFTAASREKQSFIHILMRLIPRKCSLVAKPCTM